MKFLINKNRVKKTLENMATIATRSIKMDFDKFDTLTLEAVDAKLLVYSSNGYLFGKCEINKEVDSDLEVLEPGKVNVTASVLTRIVNSIKGDVILEIGITQQKESKVLYIKDLSVKKSRISHVPILNIEKGQDDGFATIKEKTFSFESEHLLRGVKFVSPYVCRDAYDGLDVYKMLCLHIKKDSTSFICGNGNRFSVFGINRPIEESTDLEQDIMLTIPVDHMQLIIPFIETSSNVTIQYKKNPNGNICCIKPDNFSVFTIKGIPHIEYVKYYNAIFNEKDAQSVIDIPTEDFCDMVNFTGAHKDKEAEKITVFYVSLLAEADKTEAAWDIKNNQYKCHTVTECSFFSKDQKQFCSLYAWEYLREAASACTSKNIRIFTKKPENNVVLNFCDLEQVTDVGLKPAVASDFSYVLFFMPYNPTTLNEPEAEVEEIEEIEEIEEVEA